MPPPAHLQVVAVEGQTRPDAGEDCARRLLAALDDMELRAEQLTNEIRHLGHLINGESLVAMRERIARVTGPLGEAQRLINAAGYAWIMAHGKRRRAAIGEDVYVAKEVGSSSSLKVEDKAKLLDVFFRDHLAPWLSQTLGSAEIGDETDTTARLWLSLVQGKLLEGFNPDPKPAALRDGWGIDVKAFETPSSGAGPAPTFVKAPAPTTTNKETPVAR